MSRRYCAEVKLWFHYGNEEFYGSFDQYFYINAAEPSVGIFNAWCELDSAPECLLIYDDEDTLCVKNSSEYPALLAAFEAVYESKKGEEEVKDLCWESKAGTEGRRC